MADKKTLEVLDELRAVVRLVDSFFDAHGGPGKADLPAADEHELWALMERMRAADVAWRALKDAGPRA